jgi:hypothetical protein
MVGIGIRVYSNKKVYYSIIEETDDSYIYQSTSFFVVPLAMNAPERLNYIRNTIIDIINEYGVTTALVRVRERLNNINKLAVERFYIEGVLLEAIAGSKVTKYKLGEISSITSLLGIERTNFKKLVDNKMKWDSLPEIMDWTKLEKEEREAILSCLASLNL